MRSSAALHCTHLDIFVAHEGPGREVVGRQLEGPLKIDHRLLVQIPLEIQCLGVWAGKERFGSGNIKYYRNLAILHDILHTAVQYMQMHKNKQVILEANP